MTITIPAEVLVGGLLIVLIVQLLRWARPARDDQEVSITFSGSAYQKMSQMMLRDGITSRTRLLARALAIYEYCQHLDGPKLVELLKTLRPDLQTTDAAVVTKLRVISHAYNSALRSANAAGPTLNNLFTEVDAHEDKDRNDPTPDRPDTAG